MTQTHNKLLFSGIYLFSYYEMLKRLAWINQYIKREKIIKEKCYFCDNEDTKPILIKKDWKEPESILWICKEHYEAIYEFVTGFEYYHGGNKIYNHNRMGIIHNTGEKHGKGTKKGIRDMLLLTMDDPPKGVGRKWLCIKCKCNLDNNKLVDNILQRYYKRL